MDSRPLSLEERTEEVAGYFTPSRLDPMAFESEDAMSLAQILNIVLPRYGLAVEPSCRCALCESHRANRLVNTLHDKFAHRVARIG
jgi:hypothetical protein